MLTLVSQDDISSTASTKEEESSRSDTPTLVSRRMGSLGRMKKTGKKCKLQYRCTNFLKVVEV